MKRNRKRGSVERSVYAAQERGPSQSVPQCSSHRGTILVRVLAIQNSRGMTDLPHLVTPLRRKLRGSCKDSGASSTL